MKNQNVLIRGLSKTQVEQLANLAQNLEMFIGSSLQLVESDTLPIKRKDMHRQINISCPFSIERLKMNR